MRRWPVLCAFALLALSGVTHAADSGAVVITALRNPVAKSYRGMLAGMELFEKRRQLALEVAPDDTFVLERRPVALKEDALVMPNRKAGTLTWRAEVRTPGLPPDTRRLGDLRLECEVGMQARLISNTPAGFWGWLDERFPDGPEYCRREAPRYLFFADRPIFSVTLVDGVRKEVLSVDRLYAGASRNPGWKKGLPYCDCEVLVDRAYFLPLGDPSWSDHTLVQFEYMDDAP